MFVLFFFFFKQKTAYEMRISDWSSDVCSSDLDELNGWLEAECRRWAERQAHPEQGELTVAQALEIERSALQPMLGPFDGFNESEHAVTGTCLISFDRNRYSVLSTMRSEEHTSELQSLMRISYDVFCLKQQNTTTY